MAMRFFKRKRSANKRSMKKEKQGEVFHKRAMEIGNGFLSLITHSYIFEIHFWKPNFAVLILSLQVEVLTHKSHRHSRGFSFFVCKRKHASLGLWEETSAVTEKQPTQDTDHSGPEVSISSGSASVRI